MITVANNLNLAGKRVGVQSHRPCHMYCAFEYIFERIRVHIPYTGVSRRKNDYLRGAMS